MADQFLGWNRRDDVAIQNEVEQSIALVAQHQDHVVACMANEGFDYFPLAQERQFTAIADPDIPRGSPEFAKAYGFGITTLMFSSDEVGPNAIGYEAEWLNRSRPLEAKDDPNARYYSDLDDAGQRAYDATINKCWNDAEDRIPDRGLSLRTLLAEDLLELDERIKADARFFELTALVDECMAVEGFTFVGFESLQQAVLERMFEAGLAIRAGDEEPPELPEEERLARLGEVQQFEIALATEFDRCIGWNEWHDRWENIADSYRVEFLSTHWAAIGGS